MGGRGSNINAQWRRVFQPIGGGFTVTQNQNGGVTITPNPNSQNIANSGSGISDTNTHTTYFTPADMAIVSNMPTDGYRRSPRTGLMSPVGYYQTSDYANINGELRDLGNGARKTLTPQTQKVVDAMDRNMRPLNNAIDSTRWTDLNAIADNIGMRGASRQQIISALSTRDVTRVKSDYTSSSWDAKANTVAGMAGRDVRIDMHYAKGAMVQFSPTRKEGEMVGARNKAQRFSNARVERVPIQNARFGSSRYADVLVIDCYIDD